MQQPGTVDEAWPSHAPENYQCPFCDMASGEFAFPDNLCEPGDLVYSDDLVLAFIASHGFDPEPGHVLVTPREHFELLYELPDDVAARLMIVTRDIAVICDLAIPVGDMQETILSAGGERLIDCTVFDVYTGTPIPAGQKSMAFSLELRADDRTLTDADSEGVTSKVLAALESKLGATLR